MRQADDTGRGPGNHERVDFATRDVAIMTLASGARGGGRLLVIGVLLLVIVLLAAGWILCAARARAGRGKRP